MSDKSVALVRNSSSVDGETQTLEDEATQSTSTVDPASALGKNLSAAAAGASSDAPPQKTTATTATQHDPYIYAQFYYQQLGAVGTPTPMRSRKAASSESTAGSSGVSGVAAASSPSTGGGEATTPQSAKQAHYQQMREMAIGVAHGAVPVISRYNVSPPPTVPPPAAVAAALGLPVFRPEAASSETYPIGTTPSDVDGAAPLALETSSATPEQGVSPSKAANGGDGTAASADAADHAASSLPPSPSSSKSPFSKPRRLAATLGPDGDDDEVSVTLRNSHQELATLDDDVSSDAGGGRASTAERAALVAAAATAAAPTSMPPPPYREDTATYDAARDGDVPGGSRRTSAGSFRGLRRVASFEGDGDVGAPLMIRQASTSEERANAELPLADKMFQSSVAASALPPQPPVSEPGNTAAHVASAKPHRTPAGAPGRNKGPKAPPYTPTPLTEPPRSDSRESAALTPTGAPPEAGVSPNGKRSKDAHAGKPRKSPRGVAGAAGTSPSGAPEVSHSRCPSYPDVVHSRTMSSSSQNAAGTASLPPPPAYSEFINSTQSAPNTPVLSPHHGRSGSFNGTGAAAPKGTPPLSSSQQHGHGAATIAPAQAASAPVVDAHEVVARDSTPAEQHPSEQAPSLTLPPAVTDAQLPPPTVGENVVAEADAAPAPPTAAVGEPAVEAVSPPAPSSRPAMRGTPTAPEPVVPQAPAKVAASAAPQPVATATPPMTKSQRKAMAAANAQQQRAAKQQQQQQQQQATQQQQQQAAQQSAQSTPSPQQASQQFSDYSSALSNVGQFYDYSAAAAAAMYGYGLMPGYSQYYQRYAAAAAAVAAAAQYESHQHHHTNFQQQSSQSHLSPTSEGTLAGCGPERYLRFSSEIELYVSQRLELTPAEREERQIFIDQIRNIVRLALLDPIDGITNPAEVVADKDALEAKVHGSWITQLSLAGSDIDFKVEHYEPLSPIVAIERVQRYLLVCNPMGELPPGTRKQAPAIVAAGTAAGDLVGMAQSPTLPMMSLTDNSQLKSDGAVGELAEGDSAEVASAFTAQTASATVTTASRPNAPVANASTSALPRQSPHLRSGGVSPVATPGAIAPILEGLHYTVQSVIFTRVPVVKIVDKSNGLKGDIGFGGGETYATMELTKQLLNEFTAARPMMLLLKHLVKESGIGEAQRGGITSSVVHLLLRHFFQARQHAFGVLEDSDIDDEPAPEAAATRRRGLNSSVTSDTAPPSTFHARRDSAQRNDGCEKSPELVRQEAADAAAAKSARDSLRAKSRASSSASQQTQQTQQAQQQQQQAFMTMGYDGLSAALGSTLGGNTPTGATTSAALGGGASGSGGSVTPTPRDTILDLVLQSLEYNAVAGGLDVDPNVVSCVREVIKQRFAMSQQAEAERQRIFEAAKEAKRSMQQQKQQQQQQQQQPAQPTQSTTTSADQDSTAIVAPTATSPSKTNEMGEGSAPESVAAGASIATTPTAAGGDDATGGADAFEGSVKSGRTGGAAEVNTTSSTPHASSRATTPEPDIPHSWTEQLQETNSVPIGQLLVEFFSYYGNIFDYERWGLRFEPNGTSKMVEKPAICTARGQHLHMTSPWDSTHDVTARMSMTREFQLMCWHLFVLLARDTSITSMMQLFGTDHAQAAANIAAAVQHAQQLNAATAAGYGATSYNYSGVGSSTHAYGSSSSSGGGGGGSYSHHGLAHGSHFGGTPAGFAATPPSTALHPSAQRASTTGRSGRSGFTPSEQDGASGVNDPAAFLTSNMATVYGQGLSQMMGYSSVHGGSQHSHHHHHHHFHSHGSQHSAATGGYYSTGGTTGVGSSAGSGAHGIVPSHSHLHSPSSLVPGAMPGYPGFGLQSHWNSSGSMPYVTGPGSKTATPTSFPATSGAPGVFLPAPPGGSGDREGRSSTPTTPSMKPMPVHGGSASHHVDASTDTRSGALETTGTMTSARIQLPPPFVPEHIARSYSTPGASSVPTRGLPAAASGAAGHYQPHSVPLSALGRDGALDDSKTYGSAATSAHHGGAVYPSQSLASAGAGVQKSGAQSSIGTSASGYSSGYSGAYSTSTGGGVSNAASAASSALHYAQYAAMYGWRPQASQGASHVSPGLLPAPSSAHPHHPPHHSLAPAASGASSTMATSSYAPHTTSSGASGAVPSSVHTIPSAYPTYHRHSQSMPASGGASDAMMGAGTAASAGYHTHYHTPQHATSAGYGGTTYSTSAAGMTSSAGVHSSMTNMPRLGIHAQHNSIGYATLQQSAMAKDGTGSDTSSNAGDAGTMPAAASVRPAHHVVHHGHHHHHHQQYRQHGHHMRHTPTGGATSDGSMAIGHDVFSMHSTSAATAAAVAAATSGQYYGSTGHHHHHHLHVAHHVGGAYSSNPYATYTTAGHHQHHHTHAVLSMYGHHQHQQFGGPIGAVKGYGGAAAAEATAARAKQQQIAAQQQQQQQQQQQSGAPSTAAATAKAPSAKRTQAAKRAAAAAAAAALAAGGEGGFAGDGISADAPRPPAPAPRKKMPKEPSAAGADDGCGDGALATGPAPVEGKPKKKKNKNASAAATAAAAAATTAAPAGAIASLPSNNDSLVGSEEASRHHAVPPSPTLPAAAMPVAATAALSIPRPRSAPPPPGSGGVGSDSSANEAARADAPHQAPHHVVEGARAAAESSSAAAAAAATPPVSSNKYVPPALRKAAAAANATTQPTSSPPPEPAHPGAAS